MEGKRIFVKFVSLQNPSRIKCVNLPKNTKNEVALLRHLLHQEILADQSIMSLGGNETTPLHDVVLQKFNEDYGELVDLPLSTVFDNVEKNILVRLTQTDQKSTSNEQQSLSANSRSGSRHDAYCEPFSSKKLKPNENDNKIQPFSMNRFSKSKEFVYSFGPIVAVTENASGGSLRSVFVTFMAREPIRRILSASFFSFYSLYVKFFIFFYFNNSCSKSSLLFSMARN